VRRLAHGLARAGFLVAVPDLPGLRLGEITPATTHALVRVALAVAGRGRVSIPAPRAAAESFAPHTLVALLPNRHPRRFAVLYSRLPRRVRVEVSALSPLRRVTRIAVPVELASAPHDKYFPPEESRSLARRSPHMRVTITSTLAHAVPRPSLHDVGALLAFDEFVVRFLRDAR
jgi:hypothetical protein